MNFRQELAAMQANYDRKPLRTIKLKRPYWLGYDDPMGEIYRKKTVLLQEGKITYAHVVQANELLFRLLPHGDYPAVIVYSRDPLAQEDPSILQALASNLYSYKNKPLQSVPEQWQALARAITDEYDRSSFTVTYSHDGKTIQARMIPVMIFRKLLPGRKLHGGLLPVLTVEGCKTVMILPKRYWTHTFKTAWRRGLI